MFRLIRRLFRKSYFQKKRKKKRSNRLCFIIEFLIMLFVLFSEIIFILTFYPGVRLPSQIIWSAGTLGIGNPRHVQVKGRIQVDGSGTWSVWVLLLCSDSFLDGRYATRYICSYPLQAAIIFDLCF